ncbi:MAG: hypothetical protein Q9190_007631 [Brigantiaea leucoxantha]
MPSLPPFSRSEKIEDYAPECKPVLWREDRIEAADGVEIALAIGSIAVSGIDDSADPDIQADESLSKHVVIIYFQGNGGSLPPRLPALASILKLLQKARKSRNSRYTVVAVSYRGFWTSRGRPSESGISLDALAALRYVSNKRVSSLNEELRVVLWGQSLGAAVAASTAAKAICHDSDKDIGPASVVPRHVPISALVMETPFTSVRAMLAAIYPQKWLPYRYLHPFLRSHWDNKMVLRQIASSPSPAPKILILQAADDELVPDNHALDLESLGKDLKLNIQRVTVKSALHHDASVKRQGREQIINLLRHMG